MDSFMHREMTKWACKSAGAQFSVWLEDMDGTAESSTYPDVCVAGESDMHKDSWDPLWRPLIMIPREGGKCAIHILIDTLHLRQSYPDLLCYEIQLAVDAFRFGNNELGRKAVGIISHIIGDTVQAAHTTDNMLVTWMYSDPNKRYMTHTFIEQVMCSLPYEEPYTPRILGNSEKELVWRLTEELEIARRKSISEIPIIMHGLLNNDEAEATASAKRSAMLGCYLLADTMMTVWAIAKRLKYTAMSVSLTEMIPESCDVDNMFNYQPMIDAIPSQSYDRVTLLNIGKGQISGICLLPMMASSYTDLRKSYAEYSLPEGGFKYFSVKLGIQRFYTPDEVPHYSRANETAGIFEIRLDGKTVYRSEPIDDTMDPVFVKIPLGNAKKLMLYVRDVREPDPLTKFFYPVFAEPILSRE